MPIPKETQDYADQLLKYADAVTGVAFLQALVFCYKLMDDGVAKKLTGGPLSVTVAIVGSTIVATLTYIFFIFYLFHLNGLLVKNPDVASAMLQVQLGRYLIVILSTGIILFAYFFTKTHTT